VHQAANAQEVYSAKHLAAVDKYIDSIMHDWKIPGLAMAIVYRNKVVSTKGYGLRDVEKKLPVDSLTLFPIASNTKLFTATLACMLHEEQKLSLDSPVKTIVPGLRFYNDELNNKASLRDLLSHRTGLPGYDGIWVNSSFDRSTLVSKIAGMKPRLGYHEGYIYNNMMYVTAGAVLESVSSASWEQLIRQRFFEPLQMKSSCFTLSEMEASKNYALSYYLTDSTKKLQVRKYIAIPDALGPAGTIKSNVTDMSKWMIAQVNKGLFNGNSIFSTAAYRQTLIPNAIADRQGRWNELSNALYCLGRQIQTYKGLKIASHTGSIDGYYSNLTIVPDKELAVFIVYNQVEAGSLRSIITLTVIDKLLDLAYTPWIERYKTDFDQSRNVSKRFTDSLAKMQVLNTKPSHPLQDFAGVYSNPTYGDIIIEHNNGELKFRFRRHNAKLHHLHYDQFITKEEQQDIPDFRLSFLTDGVGNIDRIITSPFGDPVAEFKARK
ncbi:MAG: serine hydrolase, partial [Chitinophagaceae bacterium]|nr:serine hydrolase [Chitinophagaceae bacterium]